MAVIHEKTFSVVFSKKDKVKIKRISEEMGMTISEVFRNVILDFWIYRPENLTVDKGFKKGEGETISTKLNGRFLTLLEDLLTHYGVEYSKSRLFRSMLKWKVDQWRSLELLKGKNTI